MNATHNALANSGRANAMCRGGRSGGGGVPGTADYVAVTGPRGGVTATGGR